MTVKKLQISASCVYLGSFFILMENSYIPQKIISTGIKNTFITTELFKTYGCFFSASQECVLFGSMIGSVLNYASDLLGFHCANDVEKIHVSEDLF